MKMKAEDFVMGKSDEEEDEVEVVEDEDSAYENTIAKILGDSPKDKARFCSALRGLVRSYTDE